MFQEPSVLKAKTQRLKTKDVKALRKTLVTTFACLQDDELLDLLCPQKAYVDLMKLKNKDLLYAINPLGKKGQGEPQIPYFYETRNHEIMPTLFALWLVPNLLTIKFWTPTFVSSKLIKSPPADLFLPGVAVLRNQDTNEIARPWKKNALCAIYVFGNPLPFAIGRCSSSSQSNDCRINMVLTFSVCFLRFDARQCPMVN